MQEILEVDLHEPVPKTSSLDASMRTVTATKKKVHGMGSQAARSFTNANIGGRMEIEVDVV